MEDGLLKALDVEVNAIDQLNRTHALQDEADIA